MKKFLLACIFVQSLNAFCQNPEKPRLINGPVLGAVTENSAILWIAYKGNGQDMMTLVDTADKTIYFPSGFRKINNSKGLTAMSMTFKDLKPGRVYKAAFNNPLFPHPRCIFDTPADTAVRDCNFLFGSCALMNTDFSRFMLPGAAVNIFNVMKRQRSDFMVWLGDNIYYLGKQYTSYDRMFMRNLNVRTGFLELREFLAAQPNYAIWDDHDYGWNDSDRKFPLKDSALVIFKGFWPNPYPAKQPFKGNYFTFKQSDAEFFMTDDRFYRDTEGDTAGEFLGAAQITWLKDALLNSTATFKFICVGSQVLDDSYYGESYAKYPKERNDLFDFIATKNIKGVIFLTGDRHYSELSKRVWKGYTFYDFTSSPLTSVIIDYRHVKGYHNTYDVPGSLFYKKNFGKVSLSGPAGNRVCRFELYGNGGKCLWRYNFNSTEVERKSEATEPALKGK